MQVQYQSLAQPSPASQQGIVIVNADDWGRDRQTTDKTFECIQAKSVSSVSAMVFMEDSERAAAIACDRGIDVGLHLNFTTPFSAHYSTPALRDHQRKLLKCLLRSRMSQAMFHPTLIQSFEYAVKAQIEEFWRIYGYVPERFDGHHHMHLCPNVVLKGLLPTGTIVRRNFSFKPGEKSMANRWYRLVVDGVLARRHRLTDLFFSLTPLVPVRRLENICRLGQRYIIEVETHPVNPVEYKFLSDCMLLRWLPNNILASRFALRTNGIA
jgi:hypothetical protein